MTIQSLGLSRDGKALATGLHSGT